MVKGMPPIGVGLQISTLNEGPSHPGAFALPCIVAGGGEGEGGGGGGGGAAGAGCCAQAGMTCVKAITNENATARNLVITASVAGQCLS